jgi:transforming growth factor-beta-induced protein
MKLDITILALMATVVSGQTIPEILTREGATDLVNLLVKSGLDETLSGDGPFTILAPTNEAIAKLPRETLDALMNDKDLLKKVLLYHVIPAKVRSSDLTSDDELVETVEGSNLRINTYMKKFYYDGFLTVNGKRISRTDVTASNGVIHFITDVIDEFANDDCTEVMVNSGKFTTLLAGVGVAGLGETLQGEGPFTIFAPTDDAFDEIPADDLSSILDDKPLLTSLLLRHVVPMAKFSKGIVWEFMETVGGEKIATHVFKGGYTKVVSEDSNGKRKKAKIVDADLICSNGVIHAIDTVL